VIFPVVPANSSIPPSPTSLRLSWRGVAVDALCFEEEVEDPDVKKAEPMDAPFRNGEVVGIAIVERSNAVEHVQFAR